MWKQIRPSIRTAINRGKALGYLPRMVPFKDHLPDFFQVYRETMQRVNPENRLPYEFFSSLADILDGSLHLCVVESEGKVICAGLKSVWGGIVQGMWGGTLSEYISESPFSLMVWFSSLWAKSEGYEFMHLGGGVGSRNDSLFRYKAGFSKKRHRFVTIRAIVNEEKYRRMIKIHANSIGVSEDDLKNSNFFPSYRATL